MLPAVAGGSAESAGAGAKHALAPAGRRLRSATTSFRSRGSWLGLGCCWGLIGVGWISSVDDTCHCPSLHATTDRRCPTCHNLEGAGAVPVVGASIGSSPTSCSSSRAARSRGVSCSRGVSAWSSSTRLPMDGISWGRASTTNFERVRRATQRAGNLFWSRVLVRGCERWLGRRGRSKESVSERQLSPTAICSLGVETITDKFGPKVQPPRDLALAVDPHAQDTRLAS